MSGRRPARTRAIVAAMLAVVAVLGAFVVLITVRYRDGLEQRLRTDVISGQHTLAQVRTPAAFKSVLESLTGEGISVEVGAARGPGGRPVATAVRGAVLSRRQVVRFDRRATGVTLVGSRAGIDRSVAGLEITEAIGGAIALLLLAVLARVLVLLDRALAEARASEAAMRGFLADASHELRTPVAALHATAERLLREQPPRPARDAIEADLARDTGRLGQLIDDLLNLARLDAREPPHLVPVDLSELAAAAIAATRTTTPAARVELVTTGPVLATGDHEALLRATRNLLDNALAVADTVTVGVADAAGGATLTVSDDGPGVPADQRERIFEPFVRVPHGPRGGTGLGLAIVRRTIESHRGSITCDPSPAGGARFTLRLPAAPAAPGPPHGG